MENKNAIIAAVVAVIVIVAAVGIYYGMNNGNDGGDETPTGDKYYFYLDGMGDLNGWYTGTGDNGTIALRNALDNEGIDYVIEDNGWIKQIGECIPTNTQDFGTFVYTAKSSASPWTDYFAAGPSATDAIGNIFYISFTKYTYNSETFVTTYDLTPKTSADSQTILATGPFADPNYKDPEMSETFYFYLDGMGDLNGWYTGTGDNGTIALRNALENEGIDYVIEDNGWIKQIGEYIPGETQSFATYVYAASASASPWVDYFAAGPSATDALGNILYISFTEFTYDYEEYVTTYDLTPKTSADSQTILATGPFATA